MISYDMVASSCYLVFYMSRRFDDCIKWMLYFYPTFHFVCISEAPFHIGFYRQYGWYHICVHGASQLHSLCAILCHTGICFCILNVLILLYFGFALALSFLYALWVRHCFCMTPWAFSICVESLVCNTSAKLLRLNLLDCKSEYIRLWC